MRRFCIFGVTMKKFFLTSIVSVVLAVVNGQTNVYHPFPDSNAIWINLYCNTPPPNCYIYWYSVKGDTIINSITYRKLNICDSNEVTISAIGGIRQDIPNKKIYFQCFGMTVYPVYCNGNWQTEKLLYDFNAGVGDTILYGVEGFDWTVSSIDSVQLLDGTYRKRFKVSNMCPSGFIIEGIGSVDHILEGCYNTGPGMYVVQCFKQNGTTLYTGQPPYDVCSTPTAIKEINSSFSFLVSPNPFCSQTVLQSDNPFHNATLTVYNCFGQQVKQINNINGQSVTLMRDNLPSGLYFIALSLNPSPSGGGTQGGGVEVIATGKIIITDLPAQAGK